MNKKIQNEILRVEEDYPLIGLSNTGIKITFKKNHGLKPFLIRALGYELRKESSLKSRSIDFFNVESFIELKIVEIPDNRTIIAKYPVPHLYIATYPQLEIFNNYKLGSSYWQGFYYDERGNPKSCRVKQQNTSSSPDKFDEIIRRDLDGISESSLLELESSIHTRLRVLGLDYSKDGGVEWFGTNSTEKPCFSTIVKVMDEEIEKIYGKMKREKLSSSVKLNKPQEEYYKRKREEASKGKTIFNSIIIMRAGKNIGIPINGTMRFYEEGLYKNEIVLVIEPLVSLCYSVQDDLIKMDRDSKSLIVGGGGTTSSIEIENFIKRYPGQQKWIITTAHSFLNLFDFLSSHHFAEICIDEIHEYVGFFNSMDVKNKDNKMRKRIFELINRKSKIQFEYLTSYTGTAIDRPSELAEGIWCNDIGERLLEYGFDEARRDGIVSDFTLYCLSFFNGSDNYENFYNGDVIIDDKKTKIWHEIAIREVTNLILSGETKKIIVRASSVDHQNNFLYRIKENLERLGYLEDCSYHGLNCKTKHEDRTAIFAGENSEVEITVVIGVGRIGSTYPNHDTALLLDPFSDETAKGMCSNIQFLMRILGILKNEDGSIIMGRSKKLLIPLACYLNSENKLIPDKKSPFLSIVRSLMGYAKTGLSSIEITDSSYLLGSSGIILGDIPKKSKSPGKRSGPPLRNPGRSRSYPIMNKEDLMDAIFQPISTTRKLQVSEKTPGITKENRDKLFKDRITKVYRGMKSIGIGSSKIENVFFDHKNLIEEIKQYSIMDDEDYLSKNQSDLKILEDFRRSLLISKINDKKIC